MDGFAQGVEQHVPGGPHVAADDDELGIERVHDRGHGAAEDAAGVGDRAARAGVAAGRQRDDSLEREPEDPPHRHGQ